MASAAPRRPDEPRSPRPWSAPAASPRNRASQLPPSGPISDQRSRHSRRAATKGARRFRRTVSQLPTSILRQLLESTRVRMGLERYLVNRNDGSVGGSAKYGRVNGEGVEARAAHWIARRAISTDWFTSRKALPSSRRCISSGSDCRACRKPGTRVGRKDSRGASRGGLSLGRWAVSEASGGDASRTSPPVAASDPARAV